MTAKLDGTNGLIQQYDYQAPTTGFSYTFAAGTQVLVMNPAGTLATGTITMPASPADGMTITFSSTQTITALTINGNTGQTVVSKPNSLNANQALSYVYRLSNTTWYPFGTQVGQNIGPAFSAYQSSSQTLSSNTNTKILFQTEEFDTNNNFASSTFTPTVAGYYQVTGSIRIGGSATQVRTFIYKNGSSYKLGTDVSSCFNAMASTLVYLNGSTDYVEFYALFTTGQSTSAASAETWFNGCLVRAA